MTYRIPAAFAALILSAPCSAEVIDLPAYTSWVGRPVGTVVKIKSSTVSPESTLTTTVSYKLVRVEEDKVVLETVRVSDATGRLVEGTPDRLEIRRRFPLLPGVKREHVLRAPKEAVKTGEETLKLAGREIKTFWYDVKGRSESGETLNRVWLSDDVPNRLVKSVLEIPAAKTTITQELVEFAAPKP